MVKTAVDAYEKRSSNRASEKKLVTSIETPSMAKITRLLSAEFVDYPDAVEDCRRCRKLHLRKPRGQRLVGLQSFRHIWALRRTLATP